MVVVSSSLALAGLLGGLGGLGIGKLLEKPQTIDKKISYQKSSQKTITYSPQKTITTTISPTSKSIKALQYSPYNVFILNSPFASSKARSSLPLSSNQQPTSTSTPTLSTYVNPKLNPKVEQGGATSLGFDSSGLMIVLLGLGAVYILTEVEK